MFISTMYVIKICGSDIHITIYRYYYMGVKMVLILTFKKLNPDCQLSNMNYNISASTFFMVNYINSIKNLFKINLFILGYLQISRMFGLP